jgi:beta-glucosidase
MSVMSSYNQLNGTYNGHNQYLLGDILRHDWGFKGYVTSDWDNGIYDGEKGIKAGMNVEMSKGRCYSLKNIIYLLKEKKVTLRQIDSLVFATIRTKILFASHIDKLKYCKQMIATTEHQYLAREVAEKSAVLLKNEKSLLPLDRKHITKIAVIGTLVKSQNTGDHGSSWVRVKHVVSPLEGIKNYLKNTPVQILTANPGDIEGIKRISKEADVVVVVAGLNFNDEGEFISMDPKKIRNPDKPEKGIAFKLGIIGHAGDRTNLSLKKEDINLIQAASSVSSKVVVCIVSGGPVTVEEWYDDVPSILQTFYSGMEGGNALARILFGDVNPSGKLPFSVPKSMVDLPPFNSYATEVNYGYYHGYTLFDKEKTTPRFPFGFGLSYTNFNFSNLKVITPEVKPEHSMQCSIDIENTGLKAGAEVAQLYIGFSDSKIDRPVKILRGFNKISLEPGEKKTITFVVKPEDLAYYDPATKSWKVENMTHQIYLGNSSSTINLQKAVFNTSGF